MDILTLVCVVFFMCCFGNAEVCTPSYTPPHPQSHCCGIAVGVDKRIPGIYAQLSEYPWMGVIEYKKDNKTLLPCSAVLISGRYMLSAAQCFSDTAKKLGTPVNVRLGEYDTSNEGPDCIGSDDLLECNDGATTIAIEKIITHPDYNKDRNYQNDIALIRLEKMAPLTDFIKPICLPTSDITRERDPVRLTAAGWGIYDSRDSSRLRNLLHHVNLPYVDLETCKAAYNQRIRIGHIQLGDGQLCAGGEGKDTCKGDSGAPLMYTREHISEVAGIVSFGSSNCGLMGVPSVYTKVFAYDAWIRANIEE